MSVKNPLNQYDVAGAVKRFKIIDENDPCSCVPESIWNDKDTIVEQKLDGHRFKLHIMNDGNRLDSRRASVDGGLFVEKTDSVPLLRDFVIPELAGTVFDGELTAGKDSNSVAHALGSHATDEEKADIIYVAFDIIMFNGEDIRGLSDRTRRGILESCFECVSLKQSSNIKLMPRPASMTAQEKKQVLINALSAHEEGVMIKDMSKSYGKGWIKVKREARFDVVVMGYEPPEQFSLKKGDIEPSETKYYRMGWVGAIKFGQYKDGKLISYGRTSGMTDDVRKEISENQDGCLGRAFEIAAQERFPSGKFRHPRFIRWRDDKPVHECIYREDEM
jgi:ATP-dependent DNA ligase